MPRYYGIVTCISRGGITYWPWERLVWEVANDRRKRLYTDSWGLVEEGNISWYEEDVDGSVIGFDRFRMETAPGKFEIFERIFSDDWGCDDKIKLIAKERSQGRLRTPAEAMENTTPDVPAKPMIDDKGLLYVAAQSSGGAKLTAQRCHNATAEVAPETTAESAKLMGNTTPGT